MAPARVERVAKRFFGLLFPNEPFYGSDNKAKPLILAAFTLYHNEWRPYDIRKWDWPFSILESDLPFEGDEPWTVLFRRAMELRKA